MLSNTNNLSSTRLLIVTQAIDADDPILGFFVRWVEEFSKHAQSVEVICLREGKHNLPGNVHVHSLGKEREAQHTAPSYARRCVLRTTYAFRFLSLTWRLRHNYDTVFVHMNQEYILIAGWLWRLLGKRVYMWRNHYAGSFLTDIAATYCAKVFCTSKHSYTVKYKKTVLMPVGVDTQRFNINSSVYRVPRSILFLSRMAPSKRVEIFIDALEILARDNIKFTADIVGSPQHEHNTYYANLKEKVRTSAFVSQVNFIHGVSHSETPDIYRKHAVFINTSPSGMFDKTLFEAAACGAHVLCTSDDFSAMAGQGTHFDSSESLAEHLKAVLNGKTVFSLDNVVQKQSLVALANKFFSEIST